MVCDEILEISDIIDDIKQNITDNQYKTIMDLLMKINTKQLLKENDMLKQRIIALSSNSNNLYNTIFPVYL